jgi:hypothetical protein
MVHQTQNVGQPLIHDLVILLLYQLLPTEDTVVSLQWSLIHFQVPQILMLPAWHHDLLQLLLLLLSHDSRTLDWRWRLLVGLCRGQYVVDRVLWMIIIAVVVVICEYQIWLVF